MDNSQYGYQGNYADQYSQQQQYQTGIPQIRNPFASDTAAAAFPGIDPEHEAQLAQWNSAYAGDADKDKKKSSAIGPRGFSAKTDDGKQATVIRKGGGTEWEDNSLLEWDPTHFRIMVGNLAGEVTDDSLAKAFAQYGVSKARVVRDKRTTKSKGFGFVSFSDGELGFKAAREMVGKYIGSHPVTIQRSKTDLRPTQHKDNKHHKKQHQQKNRDKKDKKDDPLRANTGAHIEKKPVRNAGAYKVIG